MNSITNSLSVGVERLLHEHEGPGAVRLPETTVVLPADVDTAPGSVDTLPVSRWDAELQHYLAPSPADRELLLPGVFMWRLTEAKQEMAELAAQTNSPQLCAADALLQEDSASQQLFMSYKNALIQG